MPNRGKMVEDIKVMGHLGGSDRYLIEFTIRKQENIRAADVRY